MVCLETSFLVDFFRGKNEAHNVFQNLVNNKVDITITTPSIMEIISGTDLSQSSLEKEKIFNFLDSINIIDFDKDCAVKAGEIEAQLIMGGEIIDTIDTMIAATVLINNESLLTKNIKHFSRIPYLKLFKY